ncbi:STE3-domain-containing protein [Paxillus ammoniavirescens]|nr:STE3-domain-containing protein [Paxillus ammoniavirescens]
MLVLPNFLFSVFSVVRALLVAISLLRHLQAIANLRTCEPPLLMVWTEVTCLVQFTNSIRWNHDVENWAPAWCDLCTRLRLAVDVAFPATALCVKHRLYVIVTLDQMKNEDIVHS